MRFINVGFGNRVCDERIVALMTPDSSPVKRMISDAKDKGSIIDVSCGRKTKTVIVTDTEHIILSAVKTETISARLNSGASDEDSAEDISE